MQKSSLQKPGKSSAPVARRSGFSKVRGFRHSGSVYVHVRREYVHKPTSRKSLTSELDITPKHVKSTSICMYMYVYICAYIYICVYVLPWNYGCSQTTTALGLQAGASHKQGAARSQPRAVHLTLIWWQVFVARNSVRA